MRKFTFKSLLIAAALCLGTSAWAEEAQNQTKRVLYSTDFESGVASDYWKCGNGTLLTPTYTGTTGQCATIKQSKDRGDYFLTPIDTTGVSEYSIEFDFLIVKGSKSSQLAVMSESSWDSFTFNYGYQWQTSTTTAHNPYLMWIQFPESSTTGTFNETETTYAFTEKSWYHFKLDVNSSTRKVAYSITPYGSSEVALTGEYSVPSGESMCCKGFYERNNRYNYDPGAICIDNVDIYTMVDGVVALKPTVELTKVFGNNRVYTATIVEGETLYYTVPGSSEEQTSNSITTDITVTQDGNLVAYTKNGDSKSEDVTISVTTGPVSLAVPTYKITNINVGFEKEYTISIDNSSVLLRPTATLEYTIGEETRTITNGGTLTLAEEGTITINATAEGYASTTLTIENDKKYRLKKEFRLNEITSEELEASGLWTAGNGYPRVNWSALMAADQLYYDLNNPTDNLASAIDGLTLFDRMTPRIYPGFGLFAPYGGPNTLPVSITDGSESDYAVYKEYVGSGSGENISVLSASETFGLYRYDNIIQNIKIYTEDLGNVTTSISSAGYATFSSTSAVDFSAEEGLTAYTATVNETEKTVTLTSIADGIVPANTGVVLKGAAGEYTGAITTTDATYAENALVANAEAVTGDGTIYVLNTDSEGKNIGFYPLASGKTLAAGKAYLELTSGAKGYTFVWNDGETTGIEENYEFGTMNSDAATFDLSGRKVANPAKGLYIKNGKKFIVK
ncbi:MAG: hypothetical protein IJE12_01475 [Prevotella sp.]|nr:hypothetical protein [Prevotella sp.]